MFQSFGTSSDLLQHDWGQDRVVHVSVLEDIEQIVTENSCVAKARYERSFSEDGRTHHSNTADSIEWQEGTGKLTRARV